jgi:hypothetical protein
MKTKADRTTAAKKAAETRRRRAAEPRLSAGQTLKTAMVSPVVAGHVRVWTDGETSIWRVHDAAGAMGLLGRGVVVRTGVERDRYREVGMIDPDAGVLLFPERLRAATAEPSELLGVAKAFSVSREQARPSTKAEHWRELHDWLRVVVPAAVERGEFVVIERGGWDHQAEPFAFVMCAPGESGWRAHIEAVPSPPEGSSWPPKASADQPGQTVSAPATPENVRAAAILLVDAIIGWAESPMDVAVTFGTSPHGPFSPAGGLR